MLFLLALIDLIWFNFLQILYLLTLWDQDTIKIFLRLKKTFWLISFHLDLSTPKFVKTTFPFQVLRGPMTLILKTQRKTLHYPQWLLTVYKSLK